MIGAVLLAELDRHGCTARLHKGRVLITPTPPPELLRRCQKNKDKLAEQLRAAWPVAWAGEDWRIIEHAVTNERGLLILDKQAEPPAEYVALPRWFALPRG